MKFKSLAVLSMAAVGFLVGCKGNADEDKRFIEQVNNAIKENQDSITTLTLQ